MISLFAATPIRSSLVLAAGLAVSISARGSDPGNSFFETKIRPVLIEHCYECHSSKAEKIKADFLLDTRDGIRKGGASGRDAIIPGDMDGSQLIEAIRHTNEKLQMPKTKLPDSVIADFEKWVAMGAPDPRDGISKLPREIKAETHWAFQPLNRPELPSVYDAAWPRGRIDQFVLARLESKNLKPVADADRHKLIRRATLELTGLPPSESEIAAFVDDPLDTPAAFEKVVDRLLAGDGFGERWGRHWLDVARYAESSGYSRNMLYPYAWRYRDWVITAFNSDVPYHEFVRQQIAGDLLPFENPGDRDSKMIATGFLTIGPKTFNESDPLLFELNTADEQIDATCRAFLALTANCSRCHDHKYDPIPTRDYYAMAGIFRSSKNLAGSETNVRAEHSKAYPLGPDGVAIEAKREAAIKRADEVQKEYLELVKVRNDLRAELEKKKIDWKKEPTPELKKADEAVNAFQQTVKDSKAAIPEPPDYAMAMAEADRISLEEWKKKFEENTKAKLPTDPRIADSPLFEKGVHKNPLDPVPRGVLTLFEKQLPDPAIDERSSGRLQLANWLTDPKNPLTARVWVNRVWHHLFGTGLVDTVDNFGLLGASPSHPELLDDLAARFMESGWSTKKLIREIMLSRTWMLDSTVDPVAYKTDPGTRLMWRFPPQRLEGEAIRDSILSISGTLEHGNPGPSQVFEISKQQQLGRQREIGRRDYFTKDATDAVNYRSVYLPMARGAIFDVLKTFDAPDPNMVVGDRKVTTVPSQALFLMNNGIVLAQAKKIGDEFSTIKGDVVGKLYLRVFARIPTNAERTAVETFLGDSPGPEEWAQAVQALICSGEFRTIY
ncbi:MAG: DUF1553 domain-containing protein [Verrucomicrobiales bacterium]|nr:DUF1553 domain-containing protein [Verrucomicrobiales bacterium]